MPPVRRDAVWVPVTAMDHELRDDSTPSGVGRPRPVSPATHPAGGTAHRAATTATADATVAPSDTVVTPTIDEIIREHSGAMYRVAVSVVRDHSLAEDVVQESVVKAWQALDTFRGDASIRTWLLRITHNTAISALRKRRDDVTAPDDLPERPVHTSVEESALLQADRDEIWQALRQLYPVSRAIVVLREVDRMAYEQIADVLDLPVATVRTRLFRARQQLVRTSSAREAFARGAGEGGVA